MIRAIFQLSLFTLLTAGAALAADCPQAARTLTEITGLPANEQTEQKARDVLELCPELAEGHFQLGSTLLRSSKPQDALKSFQRAIELKRDPLFLVALGNTYMKLDNLKQAEQAYDDALKLSPNSAKAMQGLSVVYVRQGKRGEAEEILRRAIQVTPEDPGLFYNLGVILSQSGRTEEAVESFRAAIERRATYPEAQLQLAKHLLHLGNFEASEKIFRQLTLLDPKSTVVWLGLGSALDGQRNYSAALSQFDKVLTLDGRNLSARLNRAIVLVKMGRTADGIAELKALSESETNSGAVYGALGWALLQEREYESARTALESAVRLEPKNSFAYNNLGVLFQLRGESEKAREAFEQARELSPGLDEAQANLGALNEE